MSATNDQINELATQAKNFAPVRDRQPTFFLSLAPATSNSYPKKRDSVSEEAAAPVAVVAVDADAKQRRSSSQSSAASVRILKLGPVHWGEHQDEHKGDWHEVAIE